MFSFYNGEYILNSDLFNKVLNEIMISLASLVAFDPSRHMFGTKEGNINTDQTLYCHLNVLWTCPTEVAVAALWILWLTFILAVVQRRGEGFFKLAEMSFMSYTLSIQCWL